MKSTLVNCLKCGVGFFTKEWGKVHCDRCIRLIDKDAGLPAGEAVMVILGLLGIVIGVVLGAMYLS